MPTYRLAFFAGDELVTSTNIEADGNADAAILATALFQCCDDICDRFELRRDAAWIAGMSKKGRRRELNYSELTPRTRQMLDDVGQRLLESGSRVAESKSLMAKIRRGEGA